MGGKVSHALTCSIFVRRSQYNTVPMQHCASICLSESSLTEIIYFSAKTNSYEIRCFADNFEQKLNTRG